MLVTSLIEKIFPNAVYVRVRRNEFRIRHVESGVDTTFQAVAPFSTVRMLIGEFTAAEQAFKAALKNAEKDRLFRPAPQILMHPLEMIEGGLSQIEERTFLEVALGAGASKAMVWLGPELSDDEVKRKLGGK